MRVNLFQQFEDKEIASSGLQCLEGLTVFQSRIFQMNSTAVETPDLLLLVDPGYLPSEIKAIRRWIDERRKERPLFLVFTHSDWDHIAGASLFPGAIQVGSANMKKQDMEQILEELKEFDRTQGIARASPPVYPELDIAIEDERLMRKGTTKLLFFQARGHTNDGLFTLISPLGVLIAGDYLSDIEFPFIYFSLGEYQRTIEKAARLLVQHSVRALIPGHGRVTFEPEEMKRRAVNDARYLALIKETLLCGDLMRAEGLLDELHYPSSLKIEHLRNIDIIRKELGLES